MSDSMTKTFALRNPHVKKIPNITQWILGIGLGYALADIAIVQVRSYMIPASSPSQQGSGRFEAPANLARSDYNSITSRNFFTEDADIPPPLGTGKKVKDEVPVPSQLPLNLIGTIVHGDPGRSIAHIEIRGRNQSMAFFPNREIDKLATLVKVERNKIILRNINNGRLEFIENKTSGKLSFSSGKAVQRIEGPANIKTVGDNKFEIPRAEVLKFTSDMSSIVMQASTVPHRKPIGEIDGFTITSIQPGSLFSQLGFMPSDTIKKANGENIDSPAKAIELYNALRNSSSVKITIERDGREMEFEYSITR